MKSSFARCFYPAQLAWKTIVIATLFFSGVSTVGAQELSTLINKYRELKVIQPSGLPVRVAREDWSNAQRLAAQDPEWRKWVDSRKIALDRWISTFNDRPEWIAGHQHELLDPKTQAPVKWLPEMPEPSGGSEQATKFKGAWVSYSRSYNFDQILEAARLYRLTGDKRYAEWAAQQLDFYTTNYGRWPLQSRGGLKGRMMGFSLDEATACVPLIEATRLLQQAVRPDRLAAWRANLFIPMAQTWSDSSSGFSNITLWLAVAKALIGYRFNDERLVTEAIDGPKGLRELMRRNVTADFLWFEGTFSYNDYVLMALNAVFVQASLTGYAESLQRDMLVAQNMLLAPVAFRFPDGKRPSPGDDRFAHSPALNIGLCAFVRRVLPTTAGLLEASTYKSWEVLIDPPETHSSLAVKLPPVITADFEADRMAVLKTANWQLFMHYGQLAANHAQQEALNYELYRNSTPVSVDQGTVDYYSKLHTNYFSRGTAHNVPLVDGSGQDGWAPGKVSNFNPGIPSIEVVQPNYWKNASATRRIEIRDDMVSDVVTVKTGGIGNGQRRLGMLFNSECQIKLDDPAFGSPVPSNAPVGQGFEYWSEIVRFSAPARWSASLACDGAKLRLSVNVSAPHALFYGSVPATPLPARRRALYLELVGKEANFEMQFKAEP